MTVTPRVKKKHQNRPGVSHYNLFEVADEHSAAKYGTDAGNDSRPKRSQVQNFVEFNVDGNKLTGITYEIDQNINNGEPFVIDTFGIIKDENNKNDNLKNSKSKKRIIDKPYSFVNMNKTTVNIEEIFVKTSLTLKGTGSKNKTVTFSPTEHNAVIDFSGEGVQKVRLQTNKIKEVRGAEGVKSWTIPNGVKLSKIKFYHSNGEEIKIEVE